MGGASDLWVKLTDSHDADELAAWLREHGATAVHPTVQKGFDPVVFPIIVTAIVTSGAAIGLYNWLRRSRRCLLIVDARSDTVRTTVDCREKSGRTIVVTSDTTAVEVLDAPGMLDVDALVQAAITEGASAALELATQAGAQATEIGFPL